LLSKMLPFMFLCSPRAKYAPSTTLPDDVMEVIHNSKSSENGLVQGKIPDYPLMEWRDERGNSLLHLAVWRNDLKLTRWVFESASKGKRMSSVVDVPNDQGATPLMLAIIAGEIEMAEELFQHKTAKKFVDPFRHALKESGESPLHLAVRYLPTLHPKFFFKRKEATSALVNVEDASGVTPLMRAALEDSRTILHRMLASKTAKGEITMLLLTEKNLSCRWKIVGFKGCRGEKWQNHFAHFSRTR